MSIPYKWIAIGIVAIVCIAIMGMVVWNPAAVTTTPVTVKLFVTHGGEELYVASTLGCPRIIGEPALDSNLDVKFSLMVSDDGIAPPANDAYFQVNHYHFRLNVNGVEVDSVQYGGGETKYSKGLETPIVLNGANVDFNLADYGVVAGDNITISAQVEYYSVHQEYIGDSGIPILYSETREFNQGTWKYQFPVAGGGGGGGGGGLPPGGCTWIITVKDTSYSGDVVPGASVTVGGISQTTGSDGKTTFTGLDSGINTATITASGYVSKTISASFNPNATGEDTALLTRVSGGGGGGGGGGDGNETAEFDWMPIYITGGIGLIILLAMAIVPGPLPIRIFIGIVALVILLAFGFMLATNMIQMQTTGAIPAIMEELKRYGL